MANYCFAGSEGRYALFTEACVRGWLAAILDFPRLKNREESAAQALGECAALKSEVCCIPTEEAYQQLVSAAYVGVYQSLGRMSERELVRYIIAVSVLKSSSRDEALTILRPAFSTSQGQAEIDKAYAQFMELPGT